MASGSFDFIDLRIGLGAEFGDHNAIYRHLSADDQLFRVAA
jgi:hypothetical protein